MGFDQTELMVYLELANVIEFTYDASEDMLEIFKISEKKQKTLYKGTMRSWTEQCLSGKVTEETKEGFLAFCRQLRAGKENARAQLTLGKSCYEVNWLTESCGSDGGIIHGTARELKDPEQSMGDSYYNVLDRDAMLDMLNKRAITGYAQRLFEDKDCPTTYLVICDLDNFKAVNDNYGHLTGDEVLMGVTEILKQSVGKRGLIGRIGGDEILIVTKGVHNKEELRPILSAIRSGVELAYKGKFGYISLTCSLGAAAYPDNASSYTEVLSIADKMLYLAKEKGRNRYIIFTPEMHQGYIGRGEDRKGETTQPVQYDKNGIMQYMLENYLTRKASSNEYAFTQVGKVFHLSEILAVIYSGERGFRWVPEEFSLERADFWFEVDHGFFSEFDENGIFVMDALYAIEDKYPEVKERLRENDIQSAIFYQIKQKGEPDGYIMFAKKVQRQKWSEYEILALSAIGKMFELYMYEA